MGSFGACSRPVQTQIRSTAGLIIWTGPAGTIAGLARRPVWPVLAMVVLTAAIAWWFLMGWPDRLRI
jgi:hypothetical protein